MNIEEDSKKQSIQYTLSALKMIDMAFCRMCGDGYEEDNYRYYLIKAKGSLKTALSSLKKNGTVLSCAIMAAVSIVMLASGCCTHLNTNEPIDVYLHEPSVRQTFDERDWENDAFWKYGDGSERTFVVWYEEPFHSGKNIVKVDNTEWRREDAKRLARGIKRNAELQINTNQDVLRIFVTNLDSLQTIKIFERHKTEKR